MSYWGNCVDCGTSLSPGGDHSRCQRCHKKAYEQAHYIKGTHARGWGKRALSDSDMNEVRRMRAGFRTWNEIARHFGVTKETLRQARKRDEATS